MSETVGARVLRIPPGVLSDNRPTERDKKEDALTLAELVRNRPELFYPTVIRDRKFISVRGLLKERLDAMKDRIACEQRLRQRMIGEIFRSEEGRYPEGKLEDLFDEKKASSARLKALEKDEAERDHALLEALKKLNVYTELFELVEGCGPALASRIIACIGIIHQFPTKAKFKAYLGVHCTSDGRFPRRRKGERANWNEELGRKAFFLLGDQFNRRPKSVWGQKLLEYKKKFREKHPEEVVNGKKRYTNGHILKMALWRTRTKFAEWLYVEWKRLEERESAVEKAA